MKNRIEKISSEGKFRLIDYSTSHNQFIYRAFIKEGVNQDILIAGVKYISLPIHFDGIQISKVTDVEPRIERIKKKVDPYHKFRVFLFEEKDFKHYVIADRIFFQENDLPGHETQFSLNRRAPSVMDLHERFMKEMEENLSEEEKLEMLKNKVLAFYEKFNSGEKEWQILE